MAGSYTGLDDSAVLPALGTIASPVDRSLGCQATTKNIGIPREPNMA